MKTVHLMGTLGKKFGYEWKADCNSIAEIFQLIDCQTEGFKKYIVDCMDTNTNFSIRTGKDLIEYPEELTLNIHENDIYITDVPAGGAGWGKILAAAAIIAVMWWNPGGWAAAGGVAEVGAPFAAGIGMNVVGQIAFAVAINLAISGVNELLMPSPSKDNAKQGYYFSGPVNTIKQGQPVPVLYGELIVGGAPISVTYTKRSITSSGFIYNSASTDQGDFDAISELNPEDLGT
jgi:predicted phage tail protein